jgi:hypothetical protein
MTRSALALLLLLLPALSHAAVPGDLFNLSSFTLQTPYPKGGGVQEIPYPALARYNDSTFYVRACAERPAGCMAFWAPETGAHTGGSNFPRSELRQNYDWSTPPAGSPELHYSAATLRVISAGAKNSVCIGQIHADGLSGHCSIIVELEWTAGSVVAHVRDAACSNKNFIVGTAPLGTSFSYNLSMTGDAVQVVTDTGSMAPYRYSVSGAVCSTRPSLLCSAGHGQPGPLVQCALAPSLHCFASPSLPSHSSPAVVCGQEDAPNVLKGWGLPAICGQRQQHWRAGGVLCAADLPLHAVNLY